MRDATSSKLRIKGEKAADKLQFLTMKLWRQQLDELPDELREHARMTFLLDQDVRRRDLQDFQCDMIHKLEEIVVEQLAARGETRASFRIGGHDRGTFERFFRVEPMRFMSKPQFLTALRKSFGDGLLQNTKAISKLFDSFDLNRCDEMDWRSFLFLLTLIMQPFDDIATHLRWAFAIYSACGTLDFDNMDERMTFGAIKDMVCTPVLLCLRPNVKSALDDAWVILCVDDSETIQLTQNQPGPLDDVKISYRIFVKLLTLTKFEKFLQASATYGKKDARPWNYRLEAEFYHPIILQTIMHARREARNEQEVAVFWTQVDRRIKRRALEHVVHYCHRRAKIRKTFLTCSVRWKNMNLAVFFDRWLKTVLENAVVKQIQRVIRGYNARRRRDLIKRINRRAVKMQAGFRSISKRKVFMQYNQKRQWAAVTIQRCARGRIAKRRVMSMIEALFDLGRRKITRDKEAFLKRRALEAAILLQFVVRRFCVRMRIRRREELRRQLEVLQRKMDMEVEKGRIENQVYKRELEEWFRKRKEEYDMNNVSEENSREQFRKIIAYRKEKSDCERKARQDIKDAMLERQEEERIELWIKQWEIKIAERVVERGRACNRALLLPETPDEILLSKDLKKRIKTHSKVVLHRADKQKIPMEIPEAEELARKEIIDAEMEAERERAKTQMRDEATAGQAVIELKKEAEVQTELKNKKRKKSWGAVKIQGFFRVLVARKKLKEKAYTRYKKYFDLPSMTYYYQDTRTLRCAWVKPKSLGAFDVDSDPGWVVLWDSIGDMYFYQPKTWKMSWTMPFNAALCQKCNKDFAIVRLSDAAKTNMCESCFNAHVAEQLESGGVTAQEIRFKPFNGNREDAANTVFGYIPETTLWKHLLTLDPNLKESEEEMEYQKKLKNKKKGIMGDPCSRCNEKDAVRLCDMCQSLYCEECYDFKHLTPPWDNHTWTKYERKVTLRAASPVRGKAAKAAKLLEEREQRGRSLERARGESGHHGGDDVVGGAEGISDLEDDSVPASNARASSASRSPTANQKSSPRIASRGGGRGPGKGMGRGRGRGGGGSPSPGRGGRGRGRGGRGSAELSKSRSPSPSRRNPLGREGRGVREPP